MNCPIFIAHRRGGGRGRRGAGFTLIEILVVMVLIAIVVSLATVRFQRDDRQILRDEALRLASLLTHARDEAITTGVALGWRTDGSGYRFMRRGASREWEDLAADDILRPRTLPSPIQFIGVEVADPGTQARAKSSGQSEANPVVVFLPSAANKPFRVMMELNGTRIRLRAEQSSDIVIEDASA
ncbi:MAG: type II secretion system minor pseudopilin GspH [Burkholderiales bacterium]